MAALCPISRRWHLGCETTGGQLDLLFFLGLVQNLVNRITLDVIAWARDRLYSVGTLDSCQSIFEKVSPELLFLLDVIARAPFSCIYGWFTRYLSVRC